MDGSHDNIFSTLDRGSKSSREERTREDRKHAMPILHNHSSLAKPLGMQSSTILKILQKPESNKFAKVSRSRQQQQPMQNTEIIRGHKFQDARAKKQRSELEMYLGLGSPKSPMS